MTEVHRVQGTDKLLMDTIRRQAADLEHGWREAIQNGIDSPGATQVRLTYDEDLTVVRDNGDGVDIDSDRGLQLLKNLGETSKAGDDASIGEFGVGKGQVVAKGHAVFVSGDAALHFDVREWGLEVKTVPWMGEPVDGFEVRVAHYDDAVPNYGYKWDRFESRIADRFRYAEEATGTRVFVNGERVSDGDPAGAADGEYGRVVDAAPDTGVDAVLAIEPERNNDEIAVYSHGVRVKDVDGKGAGGVLVTRDNLMVNYARNDIDSDCETWGALEPWLRDQAADLLEGAPDHLLGPAARQFLAERVFEADGLAGIQDVDGEKEMFRLVTGETASLNDITGADQVGFAPRDDHRARKLAEGWQMVVLDESDEATARLKEVFDTLEEVVASAPEAFDTDQKADEVSLPDTHEAMADDELNTAQHRKLAAARELADRLAIDREVNWGHSEVVDAWTDGREEIVLTDSAAPARAREQWLPQVFRALVHQWAHQSDTEGGCDDDDFSFNRRYRERMEEGWGELTGLLEDARQGSLRAALKPQHARMV